MITSYQHSICETVTYLAHAEKFHLFLPFSLLKFFERCPLIWKVSSGHLTPIFNILLSALCSSAPHFLTFDCILPVLQTPYYFEQRTPLQAICPHSFYSPINTHILPLKTQVSTLTHLFKIRYNLAHFP